MDEDDGGSFRGLTRFLEELTMNGHAVARLEDDFPRNDQAAGGIRDAPQNGAARFLSAEWKVKEE